MTERAWWWEPLTEFLLAVAFFFVAWLLMRWLMPAGPYSWRHVAVAGAATAIVPATRQRRLRRRIVQYVQNGGRVRRAEILTRFKTSRNNADVLQALEELSRAGQLEHDSTGYAIPESKRAADASATRGS